jgi:hypothetical protein
MDATVRDALKSILFRHGRELLDDPRRVENLLKDHCPQAKRERAALVMVLKEGMTQRLLGTPAGVLTEAMVENSAARISEDTGLKTEVARWAIEAWADSLSLPIQPTRVPTPMPTPVPKPVAAPKLAPAPKPLKPSAAPAKPLSDSDTDFLLGILAIVVALGLVWFIGFSVFFEHFFPEQSGGTNEPFWKGAFYIVPVFLFFFGLKRLFEPKG